MSTPIKPLEVHSFACRFHFLFFGFTPQTHDKVNPFRSHRLAVNEALFNCVGWTTWVQRSEIRESPVGPGSPDIAFHLCGFQGTKNYLLK